MMEIPETPATPEEVETAIERHTEDLGDLVATIKIETQVHQVTRELMATFQARNIRRSIALGNLVVKESFTSRDGVRFSI
jgi:hypothetical protein